MVAYYHGKRDGLIRAYTNLSEAEVYCDQTTAGGGWLVCQLVKCHS